MNKKILALLVMALVVGSAFGSYVTTIPFSNAETVSPTFEKQPDWKVNYDVETTHLDGNGNILSYEKTHNVLTDAGKNWIKECIGNFGCGATAMKYIAVGNGTAPASASTTLNGEITTCGMGRASGTYASIGTGNWSITYLWTDSGCNNLGVNSTALFNASSSGTMFMGDTFTLVTLQDTHQLNITITQWVS